MTTKDEMLMKIKEYQFSIIELALYLDTHPEDEKALCLHRKYANILRDLTDQYQKVYEYDMQINLKSGIEKNAIQEFISNLEQKEEINKVIETIEKKLNI